MSWPGHFLLVLESTPIQHFCSLFRAFGSGSCRKKPTLILTVCVFSIYVLYYGDTGSQGKSLPCTQINLTCLMVESKLDKHLETGMIIPPGKDVLINNYTNEKAFDMISMFILYLSSGEHEVSYCHLVNCLYTCMREEGA